MFSVIIADRIGLIIIIASALFLFSEKLCAEENDSEFESIFLRKDKKGASPDIFRYTNALTPGLKRVEIIVNNRTADIYNVNFVVSEQQQRVIPCLHRRLLNDIGIKTELYKDWLTSVKKDDVSGITVCDVLEQRIPAAQISYDDAHQQLRITVPQEAVNYQRFQVIAPNEWNDGTPSLRTSYSSYFYHTQHKASHHNNSGRNTNNSAFLSLNSTASMGPWRLYSFDTFNKNAQGGWKKNHDRLYVESNIAALRTRVSAGDIYTYTPSNIMGVLPLRGITMRTNERMTLESQFTYAPVIRGTARTNARLIVRQLGHIIYSRTLTPGPFAIDDIYSGQTGADLEVTVEEADGSEQKFTVPYTSLPIMIRPGAMRYSFSAGEYRNSSNIDSTIIGALSFERGFERFTFNASGLGSQHYQSLAVGSAWSAGNIGAFSLDAAQAHYIYKPTASNSNKKSQDGTALRMLYARQFDDTNTGLRILGYQYRSQHFLSFSEFNRRNNHREITSDYIDEYMLTNKRRRSRIELNVNQGMNQYGNFYISLSQERYYDSKNKNTSTAAGYGFMLGKNSVNMLYRYSKNGYGSNENSFSLGVNIPLTWGERQRNSNAINYNLIHSASGGYSQSAGFSGSQQGSPLSYNLNVQKDNKERFTEAASLSYDSDVAMLNTSISHSKFSNQFSAGVMGGLVLYKGGPILAPRMGDTIAIVETPGAAGISIQGSGNKTDRWGRAIVNYLTPYRYNTVSLDTVDTPKVELKESSHKVVPTEGAAVLLRYSTRVGRRAIVTINSPYDVPIGASVHIAGEHEEAGIVGNNGLTYLTGLDASRDETLVVSWGQKSRCQFTLPKLSESQLESSWYIRTAVECR
ncbi:fimbria/pilus outer membrane usher protein [Pluralibacter gergoviae]|uniref:fimbria/pilus outer membrane usher protein n=1 Tax=Pluralibacter gergoviae TaxID=61647 RepID=UPI00155E433B|nr:fimbria/pilus outer membrane usher protein [Pluralibacter gergoviae]